MTTIPVKAVTRAEIYEFVTATGYLGISEEGFPEFLHPRRTFGVDPVTVQGVLLRLVHYAKTGWTCLTIGPSDNPLDVWVEPGATIEMMES